MPRGPVSQSDQKLLAAAAAAGYVVSPFQLERWRGLGLVPRNARRGLGRGRGTVAEVPEDALPRLIAVAQSARQGRTLAKGTVFLRLASGEAVTDAALRAAIVKSLRFLSRRFGLDEPGDAGWQTRYTRARAAGRGGLPAGLDLVLGANEGRTAEASHDIRDVTEAWVHGLAGDVDGVSGEDLMRAMAVGSGLTGDEADRLLDEVRSAETAEDDLASVMVPEMSVARMITRVETTDATALRRAVTAVQTVQSFHGLLIFQGTHEMLRRAGGHKILNEIPRSLTTLPDGIEILKTHPAYRWLSGIGPPTHLADVVVALISMMLVGQLVMLDVVEDYCIRLVDVMNKAQIG